MLSASAMVLNQGCELHPPQKKLNDIPILNTNSAKHREKEKVTVLSKHKKEGKCLNKLPRRNVSIIFAEHQKKKFNEYYFMSRGANCSQFCLRSAGSTKDLEPVD